MTKKIHVTAIKIHVTAIRRGGAVWGHETRFCDEAGCAAGADGYWKRISAATVEEGCCYEVAEDGSIIAEIQW